MPDSLDNALPCQRSDLLTSGFRLLRAFTYN